MSDQERSKSRSKSRSFTRSRTRSRTPKSPARSPSHDSPSPRARRTRSKSYSRSRSRSPSYPRRHYSRSRSRTRSPYYKKSYKRSRSRSRSPSPYRRGSGDRRRYRSHSRSPMSSRKRHVGNRENPENSNCLGVFGLSLYTQERDIRAVFEKIGPLTEVNVVHDRQTGRSRGFCFVYFKHMEDAREAKETCNGTEIDGRRIRVDYSITERAHTPTPGIYLGKPTRKGDRDRRSGGYGGGYDRRGYGYDRRRSPSPYYSRRPSRYSRSRSRSRSYSPRHY
ncbi:transformer-2 protein homolog beta isoform X2 [Lingula anatina]|uniref:Transformer-2 protein homolog beta isoform X2 n=1 Tax=Lingula anatina TaxID=7574 RepID=A0A1S3IF18_LINAN|nr:transformer-2 protein homolog beta isoform X2 [Lingula anatina]|eukprot:XP_013396860.1 transformer-2 protein homolog beta isoform X2 [Lingula anatina]